MTTYKMPEREPSDGAVSVNRPARGMIGITASTDGAIETLRMSEYNAWRIFGMLSLFLGLPLSKAVSKAIKLTGPDEKQPEMIFGRGIPEDAPLGDKIAGYLADKALKAKLEAEGFEVTPVEALTPEQGDTCPKEIK